MTVLVRFSGWREGFEKIAFTRLLRASGISDLGRAKRTTDRILDGETMYIPQANLAMAIRLAREAEKLGAVCEVLDVRLVPRHEWVGPRPATV